MDIKTLLKRYGTASEIARVFGVSRQAVSKWVKAGKLPDARLWQLYAGKVAKP